MNNKRSLPAAVSIRTFRGVQSYKILLFCELIIEKFVLILHLWGYYDGIGDAIVVKRGFDLANTFIEKIKPLTH